MWTRRGFSLSTKLPIFYSALLLTIVNLLLRLVGTGFQVYLSAKIGAAGIGLLQLIMGVGGLSMVAGMAGIRTAAMYLTAEELGKQKRGNTRWVLSSCFLYSILCSGCIAILLYCFAPQIAASWIGNLQAVTPLRLYAAMLPIFCLCGVMTGYFTAANRIGTLAIIEVAEQVSSMAVTISFLTFWGGTDAGQACQCILFGSGVGACLTLLCLIILRIREKTPCAPAISVGSRLLNTAVPLALADILKSGINTGENLMVPKRLKKNRSVGDPLAAFGMVSGMVFPVLMFPACILYALAELLIPELARCNAAESTSRIRYLVRRSLKVTMLYGLLFGGLMFLLAEPLCLKLYNSNTAARYLQLYALLIPMLYCDAVIDAMTKGLGQQKVCVQYNILTSALDVLFLFLLLPEFGMAGYFASFLITHLINFLLSLNRLLKISRVTIPFYIPAFSFAAAITAVIGASRIHDSIGQSIAYTALLGSLLTLFQVIGKEDVCWLSSLLKAKK